MKSTNQRVKLFRQSRSLCIKLLSAVICIALSSSVLCSCIPVKDGLYEQQTDDSPRYETAVKVPADSIRLGYFKNSPTNPFYIRANLNFDLIPLIYQSLYKTDGTYSPYAQLAETFKAESDKKASVTVRSDVKFSDGSRLSVSDVVYSFNKAKESDMYSQSLKNVQSMTASGNRLTVILSEPDAYVQNVLDFPVVKSGTAESESSKPLGSGMYALKGTDLVYNSYFNGATPNIGRIELVPISEYATFALALESGSIDAVFDDLSSGSCTRIAASSSKVNLNNLVYIGMNSSSSALRLPAVRRAVNYSINRADICENCFEGFALPAFTVFNPKWCEYVNSGTDESDLSLNYSQASKMLRDSGFAQCDLRLIVNSENEFKVRTARRLAVGMVNSGFAVSVSELGWNEYLTALQSGEYDLYIGEMKFADDMDMTALFSSYGVSPSSSASSAYEKYRNGAMTMTEFLHIFADDVPVAPVCYRQGIFTYTRNITTQVDASFDNLFSNIADWTVSRTEEQKQK